MSQLRREKKEAVERYLHGKRLHDEIELANADGELASSSTVAEQKQVPRIFRDLSEREQGLLDGFVSNRLHKEADAACRAHGFVQARGSSDLPAGKSFHKELGRGFRM